MKAELSREVWALVRGFADTHSRHRELADALGFSLGAGRGKVLSRLRVDPATLGELASACGFDAPYATLVVDKLEQRGLVERRVHPDDRRRKLVSITPAGADVLAAADEILLRPPPAMGVLTASELRQLRGLLTRLNEQDVR